MKNQNIITLLYNPHKKVSLVEIISCINQEYLSYNIVFNSECEQYCDNNVILVESILKQYWKAINIVTIFTWKISTRGVF